MSGADQLIRAVEASRESLLATVAGFSSAQVAFRPGEGQWSVIDVVEHLYLAEMSGVAKIWAALEAFREGQRWVEPHTNRGKSIETIIATTWKPKEIAPPIATPHIGGPIQFWVTATRSLQPILSELGAQLDQAPLEEVIFPHFLSGPLDARQRLEFLRFHIQRHVDQIARIRSSAEFPR